MPRTTYVDEWLFRYPGRRGPYTEDPDADWRDPWISIVNRREGWEGLVDDAAMRLAFHFELRARRSLAGVQFRGVQRGTRTLVWDRFAVEDLRRLLRDYEVGEEARCRIDEALALMNEALQKGLHVLEWDRPGYDDVTGSFRGAVRLARSLELPSGPIPGVQTIEPEPVVKPAPKPGRSPESPVMYGGLVMVFLSLLAFSVWLSSKLH